LAACIDSGAEFVVRAGALFAIDFGNSIPEHLLCDDLFHIVVFAHAAHLSCANSLRDSIRKLLDSASNRQRVEAALRFLLANHLHLQGGRNERRS